MGESKDISHWSFKIVQDWAFNMVSTQYLLKNNKKSQNETIYLETFRQSKTYLKKNIIYELMGFFAVRNTGYCHADMTVSLL